MIWPSRLTVFYPLLGQNISVLYVAVSAVVLLVMTIFVLRLAKKHRYLVTGWFWYLGTLLPVIGLIPVGDHAMADRYSYITLTGLFIIIAWGFPDLLARWTSASSVESRYRKNILILLSLLIILAMSVCTRLQLRYWRNSLTLFQHALDVTKNNYIAHYCIADPLVSQGRLDEAIYHYSQAIRILPDYVDALSDLGAVLHRQGRVDEAVGYYKRAIQVNSTAARAHLNLAAALADKGSFAEAAVHYRTGLAAMDVPAIRRDFGSVLMKLGRFEEAAAEYRRVLSTMPDDPNVLNELGCVLAHTGKFDEAIAHFNKALQIDPNYTAARNNLDIVLAEKQKTQNKDEEDSKK
jgi:tetratricopeptide (TPR) repeat protein